ncbi:unnamed protein product [Danaus chrysippus]|uniref:(African queen) hypothetical protein n=1 Tax=Danaus chrysippus TaxID=151541 RepID=A0A8J2QSC4_9NEOP|nr:unnamed protein product [Danaus chrysippus]
MEADDVLHDVEDVEVLLDDVRVPEDLFEDPHDLGVPLVPGPPGQRVHTTHVYQDLPQSETTTEHYGHQSADDDYREYNSRNHLDAAAGESFLTCSFILLILKTTDIPTLVYEPVKDESHPEAGVVLVSLEYRYQVLHPLLGRVNGLSHQIE